MGIDFQGTVVPIRVQLKVVHVVVHNKKKKFLDFKVFIDVSSIFENTTSMTTLL